MKKIEKTEETLRKAFELALEEGFYPQSGTYANSSGGCCALGMLGVMKNFVGDGTGNQYSGGAYAKVLGITVDQVGAIIGGFDGGSDTDVDPTIAPYAELGSRLRADYYLCDGEEPRDAEVNPAAAA